MVEDLVVAEEATVIEAPLSEEAAEAAAVVMTADPET